MKWPEKMKIRRESMERGLILCASAMVVALSVHQNIRNEGNFIDKETDLPVIHVEEEPLKEMQETVVFYRDADGYLVPVTCFVPQGEGIAKATLQKMVASGQNDLSAARLGLETTIPEGTSIDLDIAKGKARVDLGKEALSCESAEEESMMVQSIVETLCRYDSVDEVDFLFDGQKRSKLTCGLNVSGVFKSGGINFESTDAVPTQGASSVQLYFPSSSGRMLIPVTRTVYSSADVTTAMLELAKGPKGDSGLEKALPDRCGIRHVDVKDGTVTVDFSKEFLEAMEKDDGKQTLRAILFTARQFPGVRNVQLQVEGEKYHLPSNISGKINPDSEIISYYPGVIEMD